MKLGPNISLPKERLTASIDGGVMRNLEAYQDILSTNSKSDVSMSHVVEGMLKMFMEDDKDFQRELKKWTPSGKKVRTHDEDQEESSTVSHLGTGTAG